MKIKHYYYFGKQLNSRISGDSLNKANWEELRNDGISGSFSIEKSVVDYERSCRNADEYAKLAKIITEELSSNAHLVSLGVGKGILEWHIKQINSKITIECTDYTVNSIELLKRVFINMDAAYVFDILNGDYEKFDKDSILLFFRVSTEFDFEQWKDIFNKMYISGIKNLIFVPTGVDNINSMIVEEFRHIFNKVLGRKDIFCGWLYSENEFLKMFSNKYDIERKIPFSQTAVYFLRRN